MDAAGADDSRALGVDGFRTGVLERSAAVPVIVEMWAPWCGPCRRLGPLLEAEVGARDGRVELVKVNTEAEEELAQKLRVQSIPAVLAFRDGEVVDAFVGTLPPDRVRRFVDRLDPDAPRGLARLRRR